MSNVPNESKGFDMSQIDLGKEKESIEFNKLILEAEILRQQTLANNLDLWSAKFTKLADLLSKIDKEENEETIKTIETEMSRLLSNIISLKV